MEKRLNKDIQVHPTAVIDPGCKIGPGTKIWHFTHVMGQARIGRNCIIGQNVFIGNLVQLGNKVKVQNNAFLPEGVICSDEVFIAPSVVFTNVINPRSAIERKHEFKQTLVGKGASIGANATIICGISIGKFSFIGAGAVVTKDVTDYALVFGNPAIQKGWISEYGAKLEFDINGVAVCRQSNEKYYLKRGKLEKR